MKIRVSHQQYDRLVTCVDPRLQWLVDDFIGYFGNLKKFIDNHPGKFDIRLLEMSILHHTYKGLKITVRQCTQCG